MKLWYVYIMSNKPNGVIYIGVTNNFEEFEKGEEASRREKQFKKWKRDWKINLIEEMNPNWSDLNINWNLNNRKFRINQ